MTPSTWNHANQVNPVTVPGTLKKNTGSAMTTKTEATGTTSPIVKAMGRTVVGPIKTGLTISGTLKGQMRGSESNAGANATLSIAVKIIKPDGTDRAVLLAATASDNAAAPNELVTSLTNSKFTDAAETIAIPLTSGAATAGDYIVIEWGFRSATTTSRNISLSYGNDNATDLGENTTDTSAFNPWWEFSTTIDFSQDVTAPTISGTTVYTPTEVAFPPQSLTAGSAPAWIAGGRIPLAHTLQVTQSTTVNNGFSLQNAGFAGWLQTISGHAFVLAAIDFWMNSSGSPTDGVYLEIRESTWNGTLLDISDVVPASAFTGTRAWIKFTLKYGVLLSSGTTYAIRFITTRAANDTTNVFQVPAATDFYAGGEVQITGGFSGGGIDCLFRLYSGEAAVVAFGAGGDQAVTGGTKSSGVSANAPTVAYAITNAAIAAATAANAPSTAYAVTTAAIAAGSAVNAPSVAHEVTAGTIAAGNQEFAPTVAPGAVTLTNAAIASAATVDAPATAYAIDAATIAAGSQEFAPTVAPGAVDLDLPAIGPTATTAAPTTAYDVDAPAIAAGHALSAPTVEAGAVDLALPAIASGAAASAPSTAYAIDQATIAAGASLAAPTVEAGAVDLDLPTIAAATALNEPSLEAGAVAVDLPTIAATTIDAPTVAAGAVDLDLPAIAAGTALNEPTVGVPASQLGAPTIPAATTLAAPSVAPGAVTLGLPTIARTRLRAPRLQTKKRGGQGFEVAPSFSPPRHRPITRMLAAPAQLLAVARFRPAALRLRVPSRLLRAPLVLQARSTAPAVLAAQPTTRVVGGAELQARSRFLPAIVSAERAAPPAAVVFIPAPAPRRRPAAASIATDDDTIVRLLLEDVA